MDCLLFCFTRLQLNIFGFFKQALVLTVEHKRFAYFVVFIFLFNHSMILDRLVDDATLTTATNSKYDVIYVDRLVCY